MDSYIEQQEKELHRKLVAKHDEVMASWRDFREQMAILRTRRSPGSADTTSHG